MTNQPTRRDFLAASALGFFGLRMPASLRPASERAYDGLLYVGTYTSADGRTEGVYRVQLEADSGELRYLGQADAGPDPSFLALHPNGRVLYAANELMEYGGKPTGAVTALAIDPTSGELAKLNTQSSAGTGPCYVSVDRTGHALLVANYMGGNVSVLPIEQDGRLAAVSDRDQHQGTGPDRERQEGPHAHCFLTDPSNRFAISADLGTDHLYVYELDAERGRLRRRADADATLKPGAGPRHAVFHPRQPVAYVANELDSTVSTLRFERESGKLTLADTRSTLPSGAQETNCPADIHLSRSARTLYVSNRGHNSIAVYSVATTGTLTLDQVVPTEGDWPRNFSLDPSERWLLVANQRSGDIVLLARDPHTGHLKHTGNKLSLPSPVCLRFRAHAGRST